jgi:hypothetical protein
MDSTTNKKGGDNNLALFGLIDKGRGKRLTKCKGKNEESAS